MATNNIKVSKPTKEILDNVTSFVQAAECMLERERFGLKSAYENWEDYDDDDEEKKLILRIRKGIAENEDMEEKDIDGRILAYEYLRARYTTRLGHVNMVANILIDNCCDPTEDVLEFHPSFYQNHVDPEQ